MLIHRMSERSRHEQRTGMLGLRVMVNTLVMRADKGITDEGGADWMTIDHPF